jgi:hypothetical protein
MYDHIRMESGDTWVDLPVVCDVMLRQVEQEQFFAAECCLQSVS